MTTRIVFFKLYLEKTLQFYNRSYVYIDSELLYSYSVSKAKVR